VDFTDPASVLVALNRDFPMQRHGNRFFTICYGVIDLLEEKLVYSNAGHPPAVLVPDTGASQRLESIGIPIGCSPTASYENRARAFRKGDILYLFSDGAFEARGSARSFDVFEQFLARTRGDAGTSLDEIVKGLKPLNGSTHFSDDVTIMRLAYGQADSQ
jgi:phosphoserine phosphatase RsbU/P